MRSCIVVPTIRESCVKDFMEAWKPEFVDNYLIVVEDNPERSFHLPPWPGHIAPCHVSWKEIDADLKSDGWIIPRRSGAIRNYGNLLASRIPGLDMIVNLDDDCMPDASRFLDTHMLALDTPGDLLPMFDTMWSLDLGSCKPRGYPKALRSSRTVLNHGLWNGVPDIDGETQIETGLQEVRFGRQSLQIPRGVLFPMSAMNIAFRPELLPAMYNLPMGQGQPFHRFDDIWCGLIMKKACDAMGWSVRSGSPCIRHIRASDAKKNAELEAPGIVENEKVWEVLHRLDVSREHEWRGRDPIKPTLHEALETIHNALVGREPYWTKAADAAEIWREHVEGNRL